MRFFRSVAAFLLLPGAGLSVSSSSAQAPHALESPAQPSHPFTVVGPGGAVLGWQSGIFELWQDPVKVLSDVRVQARLQDYNATIDMNALPATIEVRPSETILTMAHAAIVVREHLLVDRTGLLPHTPALAYFEVRSTRPADLTFSFRSILHRQWPAPNFGTPGASWRNVAGGAGYLLETDDPGFFGVVAMPGAEPSSPTPYQERASDGLTRLQVHVDPVKDAGRIYPLLTAVYQGSAADQSTEEGLLRAVLAEQSDVGRVAAANRRYATGFSERVLSMHSPDPSFDDAFRWAEFSIDQSRESSKGVMGLTAGWSSSGETDRPGFGWFFGRDTLWSLYAVNSEGDWSVSREAMELLLRHQRADGKMMHELSQTADDVAWDKMPYLYAAADSTPLFLMQMEDYVRMSGDLDYLTRHWDQVKRAFQFEQAHTEQGLASNAEGTGWVEEWPGVRPHQEIYLGALYVQGCESMQELASLMHDGTLRDAAAAAASQGRHALEAFRSPVGTYAFSRNADGSFDTTPSIFPAVAWWQDAHGLTAPEPTLRAWATSDFSVDWGIRSVPSNAAIYDPISYHHGSVWPLYAGWVAMAEFRTGRTLQANERVRQLLELYRAQDPGATTEVLSGEFMEPLARSSSHQLWSSAMAVTTVVRGVLGLAPDALYHTLQLAPHLPASWDGVTVSHVHVGADIFDLRMTRNNGKLEVVATSSAPTVLCLVTAAASSPCNETPRATHVASLPLPPVEVDFPAPLPAEGDRSSTMHVLEQRYTGDNLTLELEAPEGSTQTLTLRRNQQIGQVQVEGGELVQGNLIVHFGLSAESPQKEGETSQYVAQRVTLRWRNDQAHKELR